MREEKFRQYLFFRQWRALKDYCNGLGVSVMGDLPCYVHHDSADVWGNPSLFKLDEKGNPAFVSGVPPDYFSRTGQLWGNPVYDWGALRKSRYAWWVSQGPSQPETLRPCADRSLQGARCHIGKSPRRAERPLRGKWVPAPAGDLFRTLARRIPQGSLVAEDLGFITPDVRAVLDRLRVARHAGASLCLRFRRRARSIMHRTATSSVTSSYTGTHDNNTVRGWFEKEAGRERRKSDLFAYLGDPGSDRSGSTKQ